MGSKKQLHIQHVSYQILSSRHVVCSVLLLHRELQRHRVLSKLGAFPKRPQTTLVPLPKGHNHHSSSSSLQLAIFAAVDTLSAQYDPFLTYLLPIAHFYAVRHTVAVHEIDATPAGTHLLRILRLPCNQGNLLTRDARMLQIHRDDEASTDDSFAYCSTVRTVQYVSSPVRGPIHIDEQQDPPDRSRLAGPAFQTAKAQPVAKRPALAKALSVLRSSHHHQANECDSRVRTDALCLSSCHGHNDAGLTSVDRRAIPDTPVSRQGIN